MIIENPDTFKSWLTSILEPLCDADPAALAKYVYALVKKEKPIEELREGMLDQLDVFLQHETKPFVDMLFKSLESQEYLNGAVLEPETGEQCEPPAEPEPCVEQAASNGITEPLEALDKQPPPPGVMPRQRVVLTRGEKPRPRQEQTLVKVLPLTELLEEPVDQPPRRRDRRGDSLRDKEDRRRRRSRSWERRGRPRRHLSPNGDRRRPVSRSPSPRRYRNRSPPPPPALERPPSRSRSRSPMSGRDRQHERDRARVPREMERDRMSRDRDHRERVSRSRDRERSRSRDRSLGSGEVGINDRLPPGYKRRCRDFDEKGYCMRGDLCQWDHGTDPLVLEDTALSRVLAMPRVPEYNPLSPDIWGAPALPFGPPRLPPPAPPLHPHAPRELVPIPRIRPAGPPASAQIPPVAPPAAKPATPKKQFDYNRIGQNRQPIGPNSTNCSLRVKRVPRGLNDITHLNNHFGRFGKIVNIQVCYEGDPEGALITFSNHAEANVAFKSTEAVLNNRFIKVFWQTTESKQENAPLSDTAVNHKGQCAPQSAAVITNSFNKVLINKDNMKATADSKQAVADKQSKEQQCPNGRPEPRVSDRSRQVMEMHKRAQTLLQTQLHQQTLLINKLETGNVTGPQKAALMEAINSAQEGIEKLQKELVAYNKTLMQVQEETVARSMQRLQLAQANAKRPKTREEAQKEILDAELDMFSKQQEGQDVTEAQKKIAEMRRQMSIHFPSHHMVARRPHARGARVYNTSNRYSRSNIGPSTIKVFQNQSIDHRPRALLVSGFETDELDSLVKHLSQFGEVTGKEVNLAVPELIIQFKARSQAEIAAARGKNYNERTLSITWVTNNKPITQVSPPTGPAVTSPPTAPPAVVAAPPAHNGNGTDDNKLSEDNQQASQEMSEEALLQFDEEEEEDEDRTWRR